MERKLEYVINNGIKKVKDYRGIPINVPIDSQRLAGKWVYGALRLVDEFRERPAFDLSKAIPRKAYILFYDERSYGMSMYTEVEVWLDSVTQKVGGEHWEGDILSNPKYPGCFFEIVWDEADKIWKPKLCYGILNEQYSTKLRDYKNEGWCMSKSWYPKTTPRYQHKNQKKDWIFIGGSDVDGPCDLWIEQDSLGLGIIHKIYQDLETGGYPVKCEELGEVGELAYYDPVLFESLLERQLIQ